MSSGKSLCKGSVTGVRFQYKFGYVNNFNIMNSHSMFGNYYMQTGMVKVLSAYF